MPYSLDYKLLVVQNKFSLIVGAVFQPTVYVIFQLVHGVVPRYADIAFLVPTHHVVVVEQNHSCCRVDLSISKLAPATY